MQVDKVLVANLPVATEELYDAGGSQLTFWKNTLTTPVVDSMQVYQTSDVWVKRSAINNADGNGAQV